ncbi:MAG: DUF1549 domain-containing protein [Planctomycetota bacterium]
MQLASAKLAIDDASAPSLPDRIDAYLDRVAAERGVEPAPAVADGRFLRRLSLDLAGAIPRYADMRSFVESDDAEKRPQAIARLLASPRHATHLATVWRDLLIPAERGDFEQRLNAVGLHNWLRDRFARNVRYDNVVYDLLVATDAGELGPASYFSAHELKPERLASNSARLMLGVSLDCAQCHDHPFADWKQTDFWGYAAFFARVRAEDDMMMQRGAVSRLIDADRGEVRLPGDESGDPIPPRPLLGEALEDVPFETRREQLALWIAERDNPFVARAAVNAVWTRLFGRGLVEEINAAGAHYPAAYAPLLDEIAAEFVASGFDLRELHGWIVSTHAYERAAAESASSRQAQAFVAMAPRRLAAEQLYDSLARLAPVSATDDPFQGNPARDAFVRRMRAGDADQLAFTGSTLQSLVMLNGDAVQNATNAPRGGLVAALAAPFLSDTDRVNAITLALLGREATTAENAEMSGFLQGATDGERPQLIADIVWAMANSTEMAFNH